MGAPIYLVSACSSGEEFVSAFRRYADKTGLFIPISEPLPPGARSRFAVTLSDGGVMIEGEAEIVSSARTPSVLHGRVGMTLRFHAPDEASRTTLGELEKARLSMRPPPPSVPPRPAEIPAEPRPVPPPIQGRIDAVNALAECVAIGDTAVLGPPLPAAAPLPPKAGPRFVAPTPPAGGRAVPSSSPAGGLGVAVGSSEPSHSPAAAMPVIANPEPRDAAPPSITPRATPQPDRLRHAEPEPLEPAISGLSKTMTAATPLEPGPTSDTMIAAIPVPPGPTEPRHAVEMPVAVPRAETRPDDVASSAEPLDSPISETLTAVPVPGTLAPSSPTDIGGALVVPIEAEENESARTQIHAGAPTPPVSALPRESLATTAPELDGPAPDVPVSPVPREPTEPSDLTETQPGSPPRAVRPRMIDALTTLGMPPTRAPAPPAPPTPTMFSALDVEIAEPTDISMPPEPPDLPSRPTRAPSAPPISSQIEAAVASYAEAAPVSQPMFAEPEPEPEPDASGPRSRRTVIGVAVTPMGSMIPPATPAVPMEPLEREPTTDEIVAQDRAVLGDSAIDEVAATLRPAPHALSAGSPREVRTPRTIWSPATGAPLPRGPSPGPAASGLPSGDWTIARDPEAPDGWSDPYERLAPPIASPPSIAPPPPIAGSDAPRSPLGMAAAQPPDGGPRRPSPLPNEQPIVEPKVQIDPTLIVPHHALPPDEPMAAAAAPPGMALYDGATPGLEAPAIQMMVATPQQMLFSPHDPQEMQGGQAPAYAFDPSYQMVPVGMQPQPPQVLTAGGSGFGDPRYASDVALPVASRRQQLIIVLITAVVAVLIGIAALLIHKRQSASTSRTRTEQPTTTGHGEPPAAPTNQPAAVQPPGPSAPTSPGPPNPPSPTEAAPSVTAPPAAAEQAAAGTAQPSSPAPDTATTPAASPAGECFADVRSQPPGADILVDQSVIGTTPQRVALPCGRETALVIRKPRLVPVTRSITPTPDGVLVQVSLGRQTFLVKVSSTPPGATITLNGKSLGVTPTMIKVPAFEPSTLIFTKEGYETEPQKIAPKANGIPVHTVLKKLERKKPR